MTLKTQQKHGKGRVSCILRTFIFPLLEASHAAQIQLFPSGKAENDVEIEKMKVN